MIARDPLIRYYFNYCSFFPIILVDYYEVDYRHFWCDFNSFGNRISTDIFNFQSTSKLNLSGRVETIIFFLFFACTIFNYTKNEGNHLSEAGQQNWNETRPCLVNLVHAQLTGGVLHTFAHISFGQRSFASLSCSREPPRYCGAYKALIILLCIIIGAKTEQMQKKLSAFMPGVCVLCVIWLCIYNISWNGIGIMPIARGSDQKAKRQQPVTHPLTSSTIDTIQQRFMAVGCRRPTANECKYFDLLETHKTYAATKSRLGAHRHHVIRFVVSLLFLICRSDMAANICMICY